MVLMKRFVRSKKKLKKQQITPKQTQKSIKQADVILCASKQIQDVIKFRIISDINYKNLNLKSSVSVIIIFL